MKLKTSSTPFEKPIRHQHLDELYRELDAIYWGWKLVASCANWMMLAGFAPSLLGQSRVVLQTNCVKICGASLGI